METKTRLLIVMECIKGGRLKDLLKEKANKKESFTEYEAATVMRALARAIGYLHGKNIVHRDVKPENIVFEDREDLSSLKLIDFGLSGQFSMESKALFTDKCGTFIYLAPEVHITKQYSKVFFVAFLSQDNRFLLAGRYLESRNHSIYDAQ